MIIVECVSIHFKTKVLEYWQKEQNVVDSSSSQTSPLAVGGHSGELGPASRHSYQNDPKLINRWPVWWTRQPVRTGRASLPRKLLAKCKAASSCRKVRWWKSTKGATIGVRVSYRWRCPFRLKLCTVQMPAYTITPRLTMIGHICGGLKSDRSLENSMEVSHSVHHSAVFYDSHEHGSDQGLSSIRVAK